MLKDKGAAAQGTDSEILPPCDSYCEHGGVCVLREGHEGQHDSRYCQWDDAHALTKKAADNRLSETPNGRWYLDTFGQLESAMRGFVKSVASAASDPKGPSKDLP